MALDMDYWERVEPYELFRAVAAPGNRRHVVRVMRKLTPDPVWTGIIIDMVRSARLEIRCFTSWMAEKLQPETYLEVGVRRGFSMAMVASRCPNAELFGFDMWVEGYGSVDNPGTDYVQNELHKVGYRKRVHFYNGDSHKTLPVFFGQSELPRSSNAQPDLISRLLQPGRRRAHAPSGGTRPVMLDLITIDGDHSLLGGYQDLVDSMPHCKIGGVVLFDDIAPDVSAIEPERLRAELGPDPHGWGNLLGVWRAVQEQFPSFRYFEYTRNAPGVGIAVRLR